MLFSPESDLIFRNRFELRLADFFGATEKETKELFSRFDIDIPPVLKSDFMFLNMDFDGNLYELSKKELKTGVLQQFDSNNPAITQTKSVYNFIALRELIEKSQLEKSICLTSFKKH